MSQVGYKIFILEILNEEMFDYYNEFLMLQFFYDHIFNNPEYT